MGIKLQALFGIIITFLVISSFFGLLAEISSAEEQRAEISLVGEPTYTLTNQVIIKYLVEHT
jgi:hypothetical protein